VLFFFAHSRKQPPGRSYKLSSQPSELKSTPYKTSAFKFSFKFRSLFAQEFLKMKEKIIKLFDRAPRETETDAQKCLQVPPYVASFFELESAFHQRSCIYTVRPVVLVYIWSENSLSFSEVKMSDIDVQNF
jgi:hypothetical protein